MKGLVSRNVVLGIIGVFTMACAPSLDNVIATVEKAVEAAASAQPEIEAIYTADCEHDRAAARPVLTPPQTDFVSWQGSVGPAGQHASRCCLAGRAVTE